MDDLFVIIISIVGVGVVLLIDYFIAKEFSAIAELKGYNDPKYFWWSFLTGVAGYLMVVALPNRRTVNSNGTVMPAQPDAEINEQPANLPAQKVKGFTSGAMEIPKRK